MNWVDTLYDFRHKPGTTLEKEFLHAAGVWMACRWLVNGHEIEDGPSHWSGGLDLMMLGMFDYEHEMRLLLSDTD